MPMTTGVPTVAWLTRGARSWLEAYAAAQHETLERLAGDLLVEALRARGAPGVDLAPSPPPPEPVRAQPVVTNARAATRAAADAFLRAQLADGERTATEIRAAVQDAGLAWYAVNAASLRLRVIKRKCGGSGGVTAWRWSLPARGRAL